MVYFAHEQPRHVLSTSVYIQIPNDIENTEMVSFPHELPQHVSSTFPFFQMFCGTPNIEKGFLTHD